MLLREAVDTFHREEGAGSGYYERYRRPAHERGYASFGEAEIPVYKVGRSWYVDDHHLAQAVQDPSPTHPVSPQQL